MAAALYQTYTEMLPPTPELTEKSLPDLSGKVYIVTGGASGVGFELCKILYFKNSTVYIAGRSATNGETAIEAIKKEHPTSTGTLKFLQIDLSDLATVKPAAEEFMRQESRLDVLWHNAGIMLPPDGTVDKHGHEIQMGTNVIAPWLFQSFLTPLMVKTAALPETPKNSVRVLWVGSLANNSSPYPGGINWDDINFEKPLPGLKSMIVPLEGRILKYGQSKAANIIMAAELAKRLQGTGVLSLSLNPGNLKSKLDRTSPWIIQVFLHTVISYPAYYGGLTELWAGLSPKVTEENNGAYVIPWGRFGAPRADITKGLEENGKKLWEYCEGECKDYM
ncbi:uncharacterized protein LAJ45_04612 [Morchella importuna]|uniref:NAD(P)-binding protein n=1 Tax=Morchella conica CCBAS932 TaxID=1392247 RepID=A0A3N4KPD5_9PEZI|nr:uncharacterized protein LAJ45_04612 [Morchella importuna]KAH8151408.1 hypothetical protein LAJ45_04612 [Morchella importuna]RPB07635.1 NAD(P)-binding protein [Morchella conica CCBAS932]